MNQCMLPLSSRPRAILLSEETNEGMTCPNCKAPDLPDFAGFCLCCGFPLTPAEPVAGGGAATSHPPGGDAGCRAKASKTPRLTVVVIIAIVALGLLTLLVAIDIFLEAGPWSRYIALVPLPNDLGQQAVVLHDKLEEYERSADTLKTLVTFMIGLSTLYAIALALNAYLAVQEATKRALQSVESLNGLYQNAKSQHKTDMLDIRRDFPLFREMQGRIFGIRYALHERIPEGGFGMEAFKKVEELQKVEIAHYERTVASFEYFNLLPFREDASKIYQLLGSFHSHKWLLEKEEKAKIHEAGIQWARFYLGSSNDLKKIDKADIHWAEFYLAKSYELNKDDVATLNELGYFESKVTGEWDRAREHLKQSCCVDSRQQRPRYYLALLEHFEGNAERKRRNAEGAKKHYEEAVRLLTTALSMTRWQRENHEDRARRADFFKRKTYDMHYNRACAWARLAELENANQPEQLRLQEQALADLQSAFPSGTVPADGGQLARDFKKDTKEGEDLSELVQSSFGDEVKQLLERVNGA